MPSNPTLSKVKEAWAEMVSSGTYTLGEPCAPHQLRVQNGGRLEKTVITTYGRIIPLRYIRNILLQQQEKYMRLHTDEEICNMTRIGGFSILRVHSC